MKELKGIRYISFGKTSLSETLKKIERELVKNKNNKINLINSNETS